ncbi:MAG: hypothetical protein K1000chlam2_01040 [Chlamydiae bacterium]|nr:hypothetical protein [Chlamydiota bacterium]
MKFRDYLQTHFTRNGINFFALEVLLRPTRAHQSSFWSPKEPPRQKSLLPLAKALCRQSLIYAILLLIFMTSCVSSTHQSKEKTVLLAILARNKAHTLPRYLRCIENLDYDKGAIAIYINTNNNKDETEEILKLWIERNRHLYKEVIYENHNIAELTETNPHEWDSKRFSVLGKIRNKSMQKAIEHECDYYFVVDCDNFIAPMTLKTLVEKDKPIIAPILRSIPEKSDSYSNYFCDYTEDGYYKTHHDYPYILYRLYIGCFKVPVVHCTYLIKSEYLDQLNYQDGTYDFEFVIFSRGAREKNIDQYICNEREFGVQVHFLENLTLEEEARVLQPFLSIP